MKGNTAFCFPAVQATLTHWDQPAWWQFCWCRTGLSVFNIDLGATEQSSHHSPRQKCELGIKECRSSLSNSYSTLESSSFSKWCPDYVQGHLNTSFGHRQLLGNMLVRFQDAQWAINFFAVLVTAKSKALSTSNGHPSNCWWVFSGENNYHQGIVRI